jgi:hypothetical protein
VSRSLRIGPAAAVALAAASLLLPYTLVYDPWGWQVWGRELAHLDLATAAGPSWKPLPVFVAAALSPLGDAAPDAWLLVARAGWLLAPLLAGWLAARLAGEGAGPWRLVAAGIAVASVALTGDAFTPPVRQFTGGLSEPLLVALVLGAVALALARRPVAVLWLGVAASLLRPECWPFLAAWAIWALRREPPLRPHAIAAAALIPLAWFVPDLVGAGNPLEGSGTARNGGVELEEVAEVLWRALAAPLAAVWLGVALLLVQWRRSGVPFTSYVRQRNTGSSDAALMTLLGGAIAWVALVAAMAVVGFAGLPRFLAPATAVISVVGAVGMARAGATAFSAEQPAPPRMAAATVVALLLAVAGFGLRAADVPGDLRTVRAQSASLEDLFDLADRVGDERLLSCGGEVRVTQLLAQTALAWKLDEPIESVRVRRRPYYGVALSTRQLPLGTELARVGGWRATQLPC